MIKLVSLALLGAAAADSGGQNAALRAELAQWGLERHTDALAAHGLRRVDDLGVLSLDDLMAVTEDMTLVEMRRAQSAGGGAPPVLQARGVPRKLSEAADQLASDLDTLWLMLGAFLVFLMQAGFSMLEVGTVRVKNTKNILVKNVFDACIGALVFWTFGFGVALGEGDGFIGGDHFFMQDTFHDDTAGLGYNGPLFALWLFQFAFAATAATIVSGAVAERVTFVGYVAYSIVLTGLVYPVVAHWGWSADGWASAFKSDGDLLFEVGVIDFAGSGIVHMVGGTAALIGSFVIGPRYGRFNADGSGNAIAQQNAVYQTFGVLLLWFGWYGFNCASTLALSGGAAGVAAKVGATTTLSAAAGALSSMFWVKWREDFYDNGATINGVLAGLVGITSGCATVEPEAAFLIGLIAGIIYNLASKLLERMHIDDVVDAAPVHLFCGAWGVIAAGLFSSSNSYRASYGGDSCGVFYGCPNGGKQLMAQLVFVLAILAWTTATCTVLFVGIDRTVGLRVSLENEQKGADEAKHGGQTFVGYMLRRRSFSVGAEFSATNGGSKVAVEA